MKPEDPNRCNNLGIARIIVDAGGLTFKRYSLVDDRDQKSQLFAHLDSNMVFLHKPWLFVSEIKKAQVIDNYLPNPMFPISSESTSLASGRCTSDSLLMWLAPLSHFRAPFIKGFFAYSLTLAFVQALSF
jgi:hypothetical protein